MMRSRNTFKGAKVKKNLRKRTTQRKKKTKMKRTKTKKKMKTKKRMKTKMKTKKMTMRRNTTNILGDIKSLERSVVSLSLASKT